MKIFPLFLAISGGFFLTSSVSAQLFRDQMNNGTAWSANGTAGGDWSYTFNYDYSANGIPEAPNSLGADVATRGVKLEANMVLPAAAEYFTLYPVGQSFSGSYQLRFDAWMNYGGSGTTEFLGGGIGYNNTAADLLSGAQFITTGDGGSGSDWRAIKNGFYVSTGTSYPAQSLNNSATYYADFLPSVNGSVAGAPGFQWITWEFNVVDNQVSIYIEKPNQERLLLISYDKTSTADGSSGATTDGNISLFYGDYFTSVSDSPALMFGLIDNVVVVPEPSVLSLGLIGGLALLLRRRLA